MKNFMIVGAVAAIVTVLTFALGRAEGESDGQATTPANGQAVITADWPTPFHVYRLLAAGVHESPAKTDTQTQSLMDRVFAGHLAVIADQSACAAEVYTWTAANRNGDETADEDMAKALQPLANKLAKDTAALRADSLKLAERLQELRKER